MLEPPTYVRIEVKVHSSTRTVHSTEFSIYHLPLKSSLIFNAYNLSEESTSDYKVWSEGGKDHNIQFLFMIISKDDHFWS